MVTILGSYSLKFYKHVKFSASLGVTFISAMPFLLISHSDAVTNNCIMQCSSPSFLDQNLLSLEYNINLPQSEKQPDFYCN